MVVRLIGAVDDWKGIASRRVWHERAPKFTLQTLVAIAIAYSLKDCDCSQSLLAQLQRPANKVVVPADCGVHHRRHGDAVNFTDALMGWPA
jgi:hypothetical protein